MELTDLNIIGITAFRLYQQVTSLFGDPSHHLAEWAKSALPEVRQFGQRLLTSTELLYSEGMTDHSMTELQDFEPNCKIVNR